MHLTTYSLVELYNDCIILYRLLCVCVCVHLNPGEESDASTFVFEASMLLHFHSEVLHVGENHILHCLPAIRDTQCVAV